MPPPRISRSVSTTSTSGGFIPSLREVPTSFRRRSGRAEDGQLVDAEPLALTGQVWGLQRLGVWIGEALVWVDRSPRRAADRELEALHPLVAELDGPHDGV